MHNAVFWYCGIYYFASILDFPFVIAKIARPGAGLRRLLPHSLVLRILYKISSFSTVLFSASYFLSFSRDKAAELTNYFTLSTFSLTN